MVNDELDDKPHYPWHIGWSLFGRMKGLTDPYFPSWPPLQDMEHPSGICMLCDGLRWRQEHPPDP